MFVLVFSVVCMLFVEPEGICLLRKALTLKPEGSTVTALTVMKYFHIGEEREKNILKSENPVHIDSLGKSLLLMMLCQYITLIRTAWISFT